MIVSSVRARIVRDTPGALAWSHQIADYVKQKTGNEVEVLSRVGATQDVVWLQRFQDLSAYEKSQEQVQSDPEYQSRIKQAQDDGYFDGPTVEAGIWRQI
jgi:ABC-type ATPase with predicted acetyltransferase domain